jgi:hypothetical protein
MHMLHTLKALFVAALITCSGAAFADPPGRVARLNYVSGMVSFAPAEAPQQWVQAIVNRPLTSGDRVWADDGGRAELHVGSTALRLDAFTHVDVLNLDDDTLQLRLGQGAVNLRVRELARDEIVEIATPTGAVLIRQPGSYRIEADPRNDVSRAVVHFGQAEVVTPGQTVTVPSSQAAVMAANAPVTFELAAHTYGDDFDRWSAERDRREDRIASTRYVSRDMTGYEDLDQHGSWRTLPEYGAVWVPARVAPGWAPYRHGHWAWVSPWGWTWIDDAPWGFAPFHYGRWVWLDHYWGWAPGPIVRRPVYAPALVAFVAGSGFSVGMRSGPAVGWFPLGWREPYIPWYRASHTHVRNVNVTHVTNVTHIHNTRVDHVHRRRRDAVTVVPQQTFVSARPVAQSSLTVRQEDLARAQVIRERPPAEPVRASIAPERPGRRPPPQATTREVVAVNPPASRETRVGRDARPDFVKSDDEQPRVRVLRRERAELRDGDRPPQRPVREETPQQARVAPAEDSPASAQPGMHGSAGRRSSVPAVTAPPATNTAPPRAQVPAPAAATPRNAAPPAGSTSAPSAAARREPDAARATAPPPAVAQPDAGGREPRSARRERGGDAAGFRRDIAPPEAPTPRQSAPVPPAAASLPAQAERRPAAPPAHAERRPAAPPAHLGARPVAPVPPPRVDSPAVAPVPPARVEVRPVPPAPPRVEPRSAAPAPVRVQPAAREAAPREHSRAHAQAMERAQPRPQHENRHRVERNARPAREAQRPRT